MLSLIRRVIHSKVGLLVTFALLVLIALAFAAGDISSFSSGATGAPTGDVVATVDGRKITAAELQERAQTEMESLRQQQPTLDMVQFVNAGGLEGTLERMINGIALERFATDQGMVVSKRAIDGQIASIPALQGPDGKFSQTAYETLLAQRRLTDTQVRQDIARETSSQQLTLPTIGASQVPARLALPYASLLLEKRQGQMAFIPTRSLGAGAPPTDAEIAAFYKRMGARYVVPERRVIRYAVVTPGTVRASATPSEAEIVQAYQSQRAKYAATEKRTLVQVILPDQASASALTAKIKGGTPIADAARAAGLEAATLTGVEKAAYAAQASPELAAAAFAAPRGAIVGPLRSALGWTVVRVDSIEQVAGRTLDQVRGEITATLTAQKTVSALGKIHDALDDAIADRATFDELVADQKLAAMTSPSIVADGRDPDNAGMKPNPLLAPVIEAGFAAEQGDTPQIVPIGTDGSFAVVALDRITPAAKRPLAQIRDGVARDFAIDRARRAARKVAIDIVAGLNRGQPLASLLAATGLKLPPVQPLDASRAQLATAGNRIPPPLVLLFSMSERTAKLLEAPQNEGWFVIALSKIERGNAARRPEVINATRADIGKMIGREYVEQFAQAVRNQVGVEKNAAAIRAVRATLTGQGGTN